MQNLFNRTFESNFESAQRRRNHGLAERSETDVAAVDVGDESGVGVVDAKAVVDAHRQIKTVIEAVSRHKMEPEIAIFELKRFASNIWQLSVKKNSQELLPDVKNVAAVKIQLT